MKLKASALILFLATSLPSFSVMADAVVQRYSGAFYIVSDTEARSIMDSTHFLITLPESSSAKLKQKINRSLKQQKHLLPVSPSKRAAPKPTTRPVATVEPAASIFLRLLEKKPQ